MKYLVFLFLYPALVYGQTINLQGKVIDSADSLPVPFCSIYVNNHAIGTHANESGGFLLKIPENFIDDSLMISAIGYKTFSYKIANFTTPNNLIIALEQHIVLLDEVVITATKDTLTTIVQTAIKKISQNYPRKTFYLDGFYRELILKDADYVRLLEAAVGIQDKGFDQTSDQLLIKVLAVRKSEDYVSYSRYKKVSEFLFGKRNNLYETFKFDKIRNYNTEGFRFLNNLIVQSFNFYLDTIQYWNDQKVYVISYVSNFKGNTQEEGKLFINATDYGIIRFEYNNIAREKNASRGEVELFYNGKTYKSCVVEYRKINKKYYLSLIQWTAPVYKAWIVDEDVKIALQYYNCALYINNVYTKKKEFDRIKKRDLESKTVDLYEQRFTYDPKFWENFNMVLVNPLLKKMAADLEKEKSLEEQFHEN